MAEFIGSIPGGGLLCLIGFTLSMAGLLIAYMVFAITRRTRKNQMKHGIPEKPENQAEAQTSETPAPSGHRPSVFSDNSDSRPLDLNLGILAESEEPSTIAAAEPQPEAIDLDARLPQPVNHDQPQIQSPPVPIPASPPNPVSNQVNAPQSNELMRLLRDEDGQLLIEIAGKRYTKLADIDDKKVGQFVLQLLGHQLAFTNGIIATKAGVKSVYNPRVGAVPDPIQPPATTQVSPPPTIAPPPVTPSPVQPAPEPVPADQDPLIPRPSPEAEAAFLASMQTMPRTQPPPPPTPSGGGLFGRRPPPPDPAPLPTLNLAGEINQIVQNRLAVSPLAGSHRIDITSSPEGGIRIRVNGEIYAGPDEIPDEQVRTLIKESIKQWERT